jgi:serine/threonine protein kinase
VPILGDAAPAGRPTYKIIGPLPGGGPHTQLVMAHHEGFDIECVQKTVFLAGPPAVLFAEPRLLDQLRGDDIVTVLDAQHDPHTPGAVTFVMPFYPDRAIHDALQAGHHFSLSEAVAIAADVLTGMAKLHDLGYVHGDMKPGNALLRENRTRAALTDFGSAARVDSSGTAPMVMWTWLYLAPECVPAGNRVTIGSDVYAVGLTLHETLNGPLPYAQLPPPVTAPRLQRGQRAMPDRALAARPHIPRDLRLVIQKATAVDPRRRYGNARAFLQPLRLLRFIDWRQTTSGPGLEGIWEGSWPPQQPIPRRRGYRVIVRAIRGKKLRATCTQRTTTGGRWQRFGIPDADFGSSDVRAIARVFAAVEQFARQAVPAK